MSWRATPFTTRRFPLMKNLSPSIVSSRIPVEVEKTSVPEAEESSTVNWYSWGLSGDQRAGLGSVHFKETIDWPGDTVTSREEPERSFSRLKVALTVALLEILP